MSMTKPFSRVKGSGTYYNLSLFKNGENPFFDKDADFQLSGIARQFIAGMVKK